MPGLNERETPAFDFVSIGGGLAGLSAAILARQAGYSAALFEQKAYPFHRVCGEYVSLESWDFLRRLGLPLNNWELPRISRLEITDPKGKAYAYSLPLGGFGISRHKLDSELFHLSLASGTKTFCPAKVTDVQFMGGSFRIDSSAGKHQTRVALGTFGKRSGLDTRLRRPFLRQRRLGGFIGIKYHVAHPQPPEAISLHSFNGGYCGLSRVEDGKSCLCYLTTQENLHRSGNSIPAMEEKILFRNPALKQVFREAHFLWEKPLAISQVSFAPKTAVENHLMMAGDAAGMVAPLFGNGMSIALRSGLIAFRQAERYIHGEQSYAQTETAYRAEIRRAFGFRLSAGRMAQRLYGSPRGAEFFLSLMARMPSVAARVIAATHGEAF